MKKVLSDYIKSKDDFDRFCNLFLKKEVSRFVTVYGAEGRDKGIDAQYSGNYKDRNGKKRSGYWVFQYKFRDVEKGIKYARDSFVEAAKHDLEKAHKLQCDHYVLMTNVLLTSDNTGKIAAAKDERGYTFSLNCWDSENLIAMTDEFPYLLNSFRDPHLPVFLSWQDIFRNQIAGENRLLRYDYETFGRENEIGRFQTFVQDPNKRLLMLYGSGGIGKTKLTIEFAKVIEREHPDYEPLFVQMAGDNFETALADIPPNRKYIFFVDDAHDFIDHLGGIKILLNSPGYSESKAVLMTRKPFKAFLADSFRTALPDGAVDDLEIEKLPLEKTKEFIGTYTRMPDNAILTGLARVARDTPLIAIMVIDLVNKDIGPLKNLTKDKLIELTFESYLNDSFSKYPEPTERRRKLLEWISAIAPIDIENSQIRDKLAEILKVKPYEIEQYRDNLKNDGLLFQYGTKQRVFPDPLSDYILRKACFLSDDKRPSSFHNSLLKEFLPLLPVKVVINLARVENITGERGLLDEHVASLKTQAREGDNFVRMDILEQMVGISYFRPDDAIAIFNIILKNPNSEDAVKDYAWWTSTRTHQDLKKKIAKEAQKTVNTLSGFMKTLEIVRELLLMKDLELPNYDSPQELLKRMVGFQTDKPSAFQMKALEIFEIWKTEDKPKLSLALLNALDSLLVLDFSETVSEGGGLKFGWHHLVYTPELTGLRSKAIDLIEYCLKTSQYSSVRAEAIGSISRAINPLESPFRQGISKEDQDLLQEEQARLFNILADQISREFNFTVLNAIDQCLDGYAKNRYLEGFPKQRAAELLTKFQKHENYEKYRFYRQFTGKFPDWDLSESPERTQAFLKKYLKKYTPAELSKLMQECIAVAEADKGYRSTRDSIWTEKGWNPGTATSLLHSIGEIDPAYGSDLLDQIVAWQREESHCASGLLSGIRYIDRDKGSEGTHRLLAQDTIFAKRIVARSYFWRSKTEHCISKEDLSILDQLSETPDSQLRLYIAESLPNFYSVDANIVLEILVKLSNDELPQGTRQVIRALISRELKFSPQSHLEKYKQVMLNCVRLERLDYDAEQALGVIFRHDPIWVVEFFENRIAYKENESKRYDSISDRPSEWFKFDAVPHRPHYLFEGIDWNDQNAMAALRRVRDWVLTPSNLLRFEAPNLLTSMLSGNDPRSDEIKINSAMRKLFEEWIDSEDIELMREAAYLMRGFDTNDIFYHLAESILIKSKGAPHVQDNVTIAICAGAHSRTHGEPSPQLQKRIADLEALHKRTQSPLVSEFANNLIESTEREIQQQLQEDEEFLEGEEW